MSRRLTPARRRTSAKPTAAARSGASPLQPARPAHLRETNSRLLLRLLRQYSPCSKADLVRISGLTAPTVALATAPLIAAGLVEEHGQGVSSGGRPPSMLRFHARHSFVAAADIGGTRLRMMLADLNGTPVAQWSTEIPEAQKTPRGVVSLIRSGLHGMVAEAGAHGRVLHLTAGAPGITDVSRGIVLAAPNLAGWNNVPLRSLLERDLDLSVEIDNDTNLAALGERAEGVARDVDNFIFVAMGTGIGAGIVLRGSLLHGSTWSAGEIGYLPVAGEPLRRVLMRETGQLERSIGGLGIEAHWRSLLRRERRAIRLEFEKLRASQIFDRAEAGDPRAGTVLETTARTLAEALSILTLLYNPELIVLGGGVGAHSTLCRATEQHLQGNEFALPRLRISSLGTQAQLFGAVSVSLARTENQLLC